MVEAAGLSADVWKIPTVCMYQAAKPFRNTKPLTVLSLTYIHFLFILIKLFYQGRACNNLETSISNSKLCYVGNITFFAAQT